MADTEPEPIVDMADVSASSLDELTHKELRMLYEESTETMRFVKNHQWKTIGATLLTYLGLIFIAGFVKADPVLTNKLMAVVILLASAVIVTLGIYQFWMHSELTKINAMQPYLSSLFTGIRALKSKRESDIHRYTLLIFMIVIVVLGAVVVHLALNRISGG